MKIRKGYLDDVEDISRVYVRSSCYAYKDLIPKSHLDKVKDNQYVFTLTKGINSGIMDCYVIFSGEAMVGATCVGNPRLDRYKGDLELISIYILPEYFGKGCGHTLMEEVKNHALENLYPRISLWALKENTRARDFYLREGFYRNGHEEKTRVSGVELIKSRYIYDL